MGNTQVAKTAPDYGPDYLSAYDSKGPHHTSKPDGQLPVRYAKGEGSHVVFTSDTTLVLLLLFEIQVSEGPEARFSVVTDWRIG